MTGDLIPANVLATHTIANVSETLAEKLGLPRQYRSIGIITADSDDVTYCALDEATKAAAVEVVYGRSLYAGAGNASTKLAGEVIGILGGITSQFGDLTASIFKRKMGIKDYGHLIPGHGGIMDRFDSVLFTAPAVYYYIVFILQ